MPMMKPHPLKLATIYCGGVLLLGGCSHQQTGANGVAFPAPQATPSAQVQIQQIQNDPHIPAASKPGIEASIARNNSAPVSKPSGTGQ